MDDYQLKYYFKNFKPDRIWIIASQLALIIVFCGALLFPIYFHFNTFEKRASDEHSTRNYVKWHLADDIKRKETVDKNKKKNKKERNITMSYE